MANSGDGTGWDEASPADGDDAGVGAQEIRDLRKGVDIRYAKEHIKPDVSSVGGEHLAGSAKGYIGSSAPTKRPDTTTDLDTNDEGRLWFNGTNLLEWSGSAWVNVRGSQVSAFVQERRNSGTDGGTFTTGAWRTRQLNTIFGDTDALLTTSPGVLNGDGTFALPAGTYRIKGWATGFNVGVHKTQLYNITDAAAIQFGSSESCGTTLGVATKSFVSALFTLAGTKTLALRHQCSNTISGNGLGKACIFTDSEVYAELFIEKVLL